MIFITAVAVCLCGCTQPAKPIDNMEPAQENSPIANTSADHPIVKTYIVGIDGEYPPYSFIDKTGTPQGFDVESIEWIGTEMGFNIIIQALAWDGIIPALNAGKIDMVYSGMTSTDERKEQVNFSKPYWKVNQSVTKHDEGLLTFEDFKAGKSRVGAQRGATGALWVEKNLIDTGMMQAEQLVTYDNFPLVVTDLQNKRIDFAIHDRTPTLDAIAGKPLTIAGEIDTGEEYCVAIRKSDPELLSTINTGISLLMQSPKWGELKAKYKMQ